eukprot:5422192-Amphidinium_carterae.1
MDLSEGVPVMQHVDAVLVVYDATVPQLVDPSTLWRRTLEQAFPVLPVVVVGNKVDKGSVR